MSVFVGKDIDEWLAHFSFSPKLGNCLKDELEVKSTDDLKYVYDDADMLASVQAKVSRLEYLKFLDARHFTNPVAMIAGKDGDLPMAELVQALPQQFNEEEVKRRVEQKLQQRGEQHRIEREHAALVARRKAIADLNIRLKQAASLDLAFVVDCTGSMEPYLEAVKSDIVSVVARISALHPDTSLRVAFIGYRDHYNGNNRLLMLPFTKDVVSFRQFVGCMQPIGNDDDAEDVFGGLNLVKSLSWLSETRVLFHIGDAPCHGREFHSHSFVNERTDNYLKGDPHGLQACDLLCAIADRNIKYYFGKITNDTDKMIARFNEIMGDPNFITTTPVTNLNLIEVVTQSVTSSMTASLSTSGRAEDGKVELKEVVLDATVPIWSRVPAEVALEYSMTKLTSTADLLAELDDRCVADLPEAKTIKMARNPFAKGGQRGAYFGFLLSSMGGGGKDVVIKEILAVKEKYRKKLDYEQFLVCHRAATFLADEFNRISPDSCPAIQYCEASILQLNSRWPEQPFVISESKIPGFFEKFNSNTGYCAPCPSDRGTNHEAVQTFSHWTHHVTNGRMMVVDCQGSFVERSNAFILTDPAVHSTNLMQFGRTNLAEDGFNKFFITHRCGAHCRALGLANRS